MHIIAIIVSGIFSTQCGEIMNCTDSDFVVLILKYFVKVQFMQTPDVSFLQSKIASLGTALFFSEDNMLPFPAYIITALKTDDEGSTWFFISRSWNKTVSYNVASAASLEFYRKGYPFSLK